MSNITLDQIIATSRTSGISIADLIIAIDKATQEATQAPAQTSPAKSVVSKSVAIQQDAMAGKDASSGQMRRINALHVKLGLRTYGSLKSFQSVYPTMLDASTYWNSIK